MRTIYKIKEILTALIVIALLTTHLPSFAISGDTHIIPFIGEGTEKLNILASDLIDTAPIKLPNKVYKFDLTEAERALVPHLLSDQIGLWTSPLRMKVRDLKWFIPVAGIITALLITDDDFSEALTDNNRPSGLQKDISKGLGYISGYAVSFGLPGLFLLSGLVTGNDKLRETGFLQYHSLVDAFGLGLVLQSIFGRVPPYKQRNTTGKFFLGEDGFPSGHAIAAFSLAAVISHIYSDKKWVPFLAYTLAAVAASARVTGNKHYPSDAFVGALLGYLVARYVVKRYSKQASIRL